MKWYLTPIVIFLALMITLALYFGIVILLMKLFLGSCSTETVLGNAGPVYLYIVTGFAGVLLLIALIDSLFLQRKIKA